MAAIVVFKKNKGLIACLCLTLCPFNIRVEDLVKVLNLRKIASGLRITVSGLATGVFIRLFSLAAVLTGT